MSKPRPNRRNLVWIDLEMTGLDPQIHVILQAALVITTADLEPLDDLAIDIGHPEEVFGRMSQLVTEMHLATGLLDRVRGSKVTVAEAERMMLEKIAAWCPRPATLCGNSIWTDKGFLARYMPALDAHLHYRMVDVSSIKVLAQRWYGEGAVFNKPASGAHDARVDILNSIAELRHYRETLLRKPGGTAALDPG